MLAVKGRYDGSTVYLEKTPTISECEVIITFLDASSADDKLQDDGSLAFLFRNYIDDGIREQMLL